MVELSSLDVLFLARELGVLQDGFVDRAYELGPGEFLLRVRHPQRGRFNLLLRPGAYAALLPEAPETPQSPTSLASLLRKHVDDARIRRVDQNDFDRILVLHLERHGEPLRLYVELFGKGNLILVGPDDAIILAQRTETFRDRTVRRGEPFKPPPSRVNPVSMGRADFDRLADASERDGVRFLAIDLGLGGDVAEEVLARGRVAKDRRPREWTESERERVWNEWKALVHAPPTPAVAQADGRVRLESVPFTQERYAHWARTRRASLSDALAEIRAIEARSAPPPRDEERERLERQIQHQADAIGEMEREVEAWERRAQRVYENYPAVQSALEAATRIVAERGWNDALLLSKSKRLPPPLEAMDRDPGRAKVRLGDDVVELRVEESPERNASRLYDEAKRLRAKIEGAKASLAEARARLQTRAPAKPASKPARGPAGRRFWFESFRWCFTSEGILVVGGRDAASNEKLVKKHLGTGDFYFHADFHGAPSCVLKAEGRTPGPASLEEAAQFAAAYSKAFAQFGSADAFWVRPEQVSKTAPTGEFVARGAFVVRGTRSYVPRLPMEVAVGLVRLSKEGKPEDSATHVRVMGGAPRSVAAWSERRAVVERGDRKPADVAKELAQFFGVTVDEVQGALPSSTLRVRERTGAAS